MIIQYTMYCDASCDNDFDLSAWGCVIISPKNKIYTYSGYYLHFCKPNIVEIRAIIKGIGKLKDIKRLHLTIFTDSHHVLHTAGNIRHIKDARKAGAE